MSVSVPSTLDVHVCLIFKAFQVTGFTILLGFVSALDSLLPQAWTSHPPLVGLWSQRMGMLMLLLLAVRTSTSVVQF